LAERKQNLVIDLDQERLSMKNSTAQSEAKLNEVPIRKDDEKAGEAFQTFREKAGESDPIKNVVPGSSAF